MTHNNHVHEHWMREALRLAHEAAEHNEVPVGCVIVANDEIIGSGRNRVQEFNDPTRHAEILAIEEATRNRGEKFLDDCALYVTLEPCAMCAGAILLARIKTVVFGAHDEKTGAVRSVNELLENPKLNHQCLVRTSILEDDCSSVLTNFFRDSQQSAQQPEAPYQIGQSTKAGILVLVPTPIGNLNDVTKRALEELRAADVIMCEDTRSTARLLKHYGVEGKVLVSNHEHNEIGRASEIVQRVIAGERVVLVSDAGMPGISDPGFRAVRAVRQEGYPVMALPGANAALAAVAASGLPTNRITLAGFPPPKKGRSAFLDELLETDATVVLYESPHRISTLLEDICGLGGSHRVVCLAREISKKFEEYLVGTAEELLLEVNVRKGLKGEIVVVVAGKNVEA